MVRALLDGTKTQTRRVVKPQPDSRPGMNCTRLIFKNRKGMPLLDEALEAVEPVLYLSLCPYGQPSDRLWVREAWARTRVAGNEMAVYREGDNRTDYGGPWKPGIHMFRRDSRIDLEITGVRVERLQDISAADAKAEGIEGQFDDGPWRNYGRDGYWFPEGKDTAPVLSYRSLWDAINGADVPLLDADRNKVGMQPNPARWDANPWVWVVEFRRIRP